MPNLKFTTWRGVGWHVSYRDPSTKSPRKHCFGILDLSREAEANRLYHAWVLEHLGGYRVPSHPTTSRIHERAYRNRPLNDEQKESNRQKSRIRARIEQVFGFMSQSIKGLYLRSIGRRRNAAAIGLINLIYNLARYEQILWLKLRPRITA